MADAPGTAPGTTPVATTDGKPKWARLATFGLMMATAGPLLMVLVGLLFGLDDYMFFLIMTAIGVVALLFMNRFGTWGKVLGIVGAFLIAMALFWTIFGLFAPWSFFDFVPGLLVMPGALIAIIAGIGAIRATKRGQFTTEPVEGERRGLRIVMTVIAVLAVVSAVMTFVGRSSVAETDADEVVVLENFEYPSDEMTLAGGSTVLVRNSDPFLHTFTIEELDIDVVLGPGDEELVELPAEAGEYILFCQPHTSKPENPTEDDMAARLTIE